MCRYHHRDGNSLNSLLTKLSLPAQPTLLSQFPAQLHEASCSMQRRIFFSLPWLQVSIQGICQIRVAHVLRISWDFFEQLCLWQATKIVTSSQANLSFPQKAPV